VVFFFFFESFQFQAFQLTSRILHTSNWLTCNLTATGFIQQHFFTSHHLASNCGAAGSVFKFLFADFSPTFYNSDRPFWGMHWHGSRLLPGPTRMRLIQLSVNFCHHALSLTQTDNAWHPQVSSRTSVDFGDLSILARTAPNPASACASVTLLKSRRHVSANIIDRRTSASGRLCFRNCCCRARSLNSAQINLVLRSINVGSDRRLIKLPSR